uniref:Uncharacterized protein n=1 Tax=Alexandrium monilatum TaxID=311494 RepID=A0A7S4RBX8_9DINO
MLLICLSRNLWASGSKSLRGQIVTSVWYTAPEASELLPPAREAPEPPSPRAAAAPTSPRAAAPRRAAGQATPAVSARAEQPSAWTALASALRRVVPRAAGTEAEARTATPEPQAETKAARPAQASPSCREEKAEAKVATPEPQAEAKAARAAQAKPPALELPAEAKAEQATPASPLRQEEKATPAVPSTPAEQPSAWTTLASALRGVVPLAAGTQAEAKAATPEPQVEAKAAQAAQASPLRQVEKAKPPALVLPVEAKAEQATPASPLHQEEKAKPALEPSAEAKPARAEAAPPAAPSRQEEKAKATARENPAEPPPPQAAQPSPSRPTGVPLTPRATAVPVLRPVVPALVPALVSTRRSSAASEDKADRGQLSKTKQGEFLEAADFEGTSASISTKSDCADENTLASTSMASTPSTSSQTSETSSLCYGKAQWQDFRPKNDIYLPKYQPEDILWQNEGQVVKFQQEAALPLLKATRLAPTGWLRGVFRLVLQRATIQQPFGITFLANQYFGRQRFDIAEDLPHLGLHKDDELATINKAYPRNISEVRKILKCSRTVDLTIWRRHLDETEEEGRRGFACCAVPDVPDDQSAEGSSGYRQPVAEAASKPLLSMMRPQVVDEHRGEFRLVMQRSSLTQLFGLDFATELSKRKQQPIVVLPADYPHLGLRKGDRLVSINGVQPRTLVHCQHIYDNSLNLTLIFRRNPRGLVHLSAMVERIEEEVIMATPPAFVEEYVLQEQPKSSSRSWLSPRLGWFSCQPWSSGCRGSPDPPGQPPLHLTDQPGSRCEDFN